MNSRKLIAPRRMRAISKDTKRARKSGTEKSLGAMAGLANQRIDANKKAKRPSQHYNQKHQAQEGKDDSEKRHIISPTKVQGIEPWSSSQE